MSTKIRYDSFMASLFLKEGERTWTLTIRIVKAGVN